MFLVDQRQGSLGSECFFLILNMYIFFRLLYIVLYFSISVFELPGVVKTILNMLFLKRFRNQIKGNDIHLYSINCHIVCALCKFQLFFYNSSWSQSQSVTGIYLFIILLEIFFLIFVFFFYIIEPFHYIKKIGL